MHRTNHTLPVAAFLNFQAEASVQFLRSLEIEADIVEGLGPHHWGFHDVLAV